MLQNLSPLKNKIRIELPKPELTKTVSNLITKNSSEV